MTSILYPHLCDAATGQPQLLWLAEVTGKTQVHHTGKAGKDPGHWKKGWASGADGATVISAGVGIQDSFSSLPSHDTCAEPSEIGILMCYS